MRLFQPKPLPGRQDRHCIDLRRKSNHDKSISTAFKVWIGAYAVAVAVGLSLASAPAHSAPTSGLAETTAPLDMQPRLVAPNDMQTGGLLFKSKEPGRFIEAPKVATDFKIDITGPVARAIVTQKFLNPSDAWLEGVYVFPLPDNAAVDQLRMKIGDRLIEGVIKRKQEARDIYEAAKRDGKKASLLEQNRPNLFTNSVANIGPNESITVQIEYQQTIPRKDDQFSLRLPLVVAPRYNPQAKPLQPVIDVTPNQSTTDTGWGSTDPVPDREKITPPVLDPEKTAKSNPVTISVDLKAGFPLENVVSHYHDVAITPAKDNRITLKLGEGAVPADKDFLLTWTGKVGKTPNLGLFMQTKKGQGAENNTKNEEFLLAYLTPPYNLTQELKVPAREVIFVIDQSGSMAGPSIRQAKAALIQALDQLKPEDKFQIIRFNNTMSKLFTSPAQADRETIDNAKSWVRSVKAEGGTEMLGAMQEALIDQQKNAATLRQVIFLTDGAIGNERQLFETVKAQKGRSRIFTVGIGSAPNSFFMSRAAEVGRGTFTHIGDIAEVKTKMGELFKRLTTPVATDLVIELESGEAIEASPNDLPDLYIGEPVIVAIKAKKLGDKLTLKGRFDNQPWSMSVNLSKAAPSTAIDKLWARGKIRQLENDRLLSIDGKLIDTAIEDLGLKHHLITRLTSLVAVDVTPSRTEGEPLDSKKVPLNLPDGWEMDKVFGEAPQDMAASPAASVAPQATARPATTTKSRMKLSNFVKKSAPMLETMRAPSASGSQAIVSPNTSGQIMLPKTSTWSNLLILTGVMMLVLAGSLFAWMQWRKSGPKPH